MIGDNDKLARLTSVRTEMEAGVIVGGLEARGIDATMSGVHTTNFRADAPGWVEVLVAEHDLPQAQAILDEVRREVDDVDWSQVDVGDPDTTELETPARWTRFALWRLLCQAIVVVYLASVAVRLVCSFLLS